MLSCVTATAHNEALVAPDFSHSFSVF